MAEGEGGVEAVCEGVEGEGVERLGLLALLDEHLEHLVQVDVPRVRPP